MNHFKSVVAIVLKKIDVSLHWSVLMSRYVLLRQDKARRSLETLIASKSSNGTAGASTYDVAVALT